jgi:hypothetical protein
MSTIDEFLAELRALGDGDIVIAPSVSATEARRRAIRAVVSAQWAMAVVCLSTHDHASEDTIDPLMSASDRTLGREAGVWWLANRLADLPTPEEIVDGD